MAVMNYFVTYLPNILNITHLCSFREKGRVRERRERERERERESICKFSNK